MLMQFIHSVALNLAFNMLLLLGFLAAFDAWYKTAEIKKKPNNEEPKGLLGFINRYCFDITIFFFLEILIILDKYQAEISWVPKQYL